MEVLYHDDNAQVEVASSVDQYKGFFSAEAGGVKVPLEYDSIDFISCGQVASTPSILMISGDVYRYPEGHLVRAKEKLEGEDASSIEIGMHDDDNQVELKSSVDQYDGFLAVELGGVKVPVEFDNVDYISCGEVHTTPAIVNVSNKSGYTEYPNGHFVSSNILTGDDADDMAIAFHADDDQVIVESSKAQFKNFLSVDNGSEKVPIEYDQINYINCNQVDTSSAIISTASDGYIYPSGHLVRAKTGIDGDDMDAPSILYNEDKSGVRVHSSIDQFSTFLSAEVGGVNVPIEFDAIDYIDCGKVVSHPVIVDNGRNIGYIFSDGAHEYITDEYPLTDRSEDVLKELPEWFGDGFYQDQEDYQAITNFDDSALGTRNVNRLRVGQHYYLADEILPAEDFE